MLLVAAQRRSLRSANRMLTDRDYARAQFIAIDRVFSMKIFTIVYAFNKNSLGIYIHHFMKITDNAYFAFRIEKHFLCGTAHTQGSFEARSQRSFYELL